MYQIFSNKPHNRNSLLISRDYWMKDNSATECFSCGKPFSTFRRRHHCRLCGQIFCSDCTLLISGQRFQHNGKVRICTNCLLYDYDDSSDDEASVNEEAEDDEDELSAVDEAKELSVASSKGASDELSEEDELSMTLYNSLQLGSYHGGESNLRGSRSNYSINQMNRHERTQGSLIRLKNSRRKSRTIRRPFLEDTASVKSLKQVSREKEYMYKELNNIDVSYMNHFLKQSLTQFHVHKSDRWLKVIKRLLRQIESIDPDPKLGDSVDVTRYVKIKKILSPAETAEVVNGIIFTKNVGLKLMNTKISQPTVVLIMFPLEYAKGSQNFMSIDQVIAQEKEYLNKLVGRIVSINPRPDVLISGSSISGYALELLSQANISVVSNVKSQIIERLSRFLQADIVDSMEKLAINPRIGTCELFEVKTYVHQGRRKTYIYFTGYKTTLGCTLVVRGNEPDNLNNVKSILEFMIFMMYHLKLETFYFRNSFVSLPKDLALEEPEVASGYYHEFINKFHRRLFSILPVVKIPLPYLLTKARKAEEVLNQFLNKYPENSSVNLLADYHIDAGSVEDSDKIVDYIISKNSKLLRSSFKTISRQWEAFYGHIDQLLEVSFHQSLTFSYSTTNMKNQSYCAFPKILQIEYYLDYMDTTLGQYIEELTYNSNQYCSEGCGNKLIDHSKRYVHGGGKITVSIEPHRCNIPGFQHVILMWSTCKICNHTTPVIPMNETTWKMSFGKFLELVFLSVPLKLTFEQCPHDFIKSRIKYFGYQDLVVKIEYSDIDLFELVVPSDKLNWKPEVDIQFKIDMYKNVTSTINKFFDSVMDRLEGVKIDNSIPEKVESAKEKIQELIGLVDTNKAELISMAKDVYKEGLPIDYLSLNIVLKELQTVSVNWDGEFSLFEESFLPSENDITRITAFQLKNFFKDKKPEKAEEKEEKDEEKDEKDVEKDEGKKADEKEEKDGENEKPEPNSLEVEVNQAESGEEPKFSKVRAEVSKVEARIHERGTIAPTRIPMLNTSNLLKNELISRANLGDGAKKPGRVSTLKEMYDQYHVNLNNEFFKQRENERKKILSRKRPVPLNSQPIVEVYQDVEDAVGEEEGEPGDKKVEEAKAEEAKAGAEEEVKGGDDYRDVEEDKKDKLDLPEKNSLLLALKTFWADRSVLWKPLEYPLEDTEHVFVDSNVIIREDEPLSLIAFCLSSKDYLSKIKKIRKETLEEDLGSKDKVLETEMLKKTAIHLKYQIQDGLTVLSCKVFFVAQFEAFREACGSNFIQSLSRCIKWDSSGGKSGSAFLKTLDDRLVIKQLSESELDSFVKMAPSYFEFMSQALFHDLPSVISKIFGFYQILIKNPRSGRNIKMNVIIMENLFYDRKNLRIFDLKGSMRNRHVEQTGKENEVLLDENMVDYIYESPLFVRLHSNKLLAASLWNDTLFLSKMNVMDYSLVIGIDTEKNELVAGIIDYIRTFTWDKKLESWVKEKGLVGGGGKRPTVVTPKQYKSRFRAAMEQYILLVPDKFYVMNQ